MKPLTNLKSILHSKRANIYFIEYCRVLQKDGRVVYLTEEKYEHQYWNIPVANTTCILLGNGTSITQAAMRMLAQAGVMVGFSGSGGTPLISGTDIEWLSPQSEYRPTEYIQGWMEFWFSEEKRLIAAKYLQHQRANMIENVWSNDRDLISAGIHIDNIKIALQEFRSRIKTSTNIRQLLSAEALLTKRLYHVSAIAMKVTGFKRKHKCHDLANDFLDHGNYLTYGLAATTLWVLGIPHGFAVMHGKTRRGALVFDIADIVKDAVILPFAFMCASEQMDESQFRQQCLQTFIKYSSLDVMFDAVKEIACGDVL